MCSCMQWAEALHVQLLLHNQAHHQGKDNCVRKESSGWQQMILNLLFLALSLYEAFRLARLLRLSVVIHKMALKPKVSNSN